MWSTDLLTLLLTKLASIWRLTNDLILLISPTKLTLKRTGWDQLALSIKLIAEYCPSFYNTVIFQMRYLSAINEVIRERREWVVSIWILVLLAVSLKPNLMKTFLAPYLFEIYLAFQIKLSHAFANLTCRLNSKLTRSI